MSDTSKSIFAFHNYIEEKPEAAKKLHRLLRMPAIWQALSVDSVRQTILEQAEITLKSIEHALRSAAGGDPTVDSAIEKINTGKAAQSLAVVEQFIEEQRPSFGDLEEFLTFALYANEESGLFEALIGSSEPSIKRAATQAYVNISQLGEGISASLQLSEASRADLLEDGFLNGDQPLVTALQDGATPKDLPKDNDHLKAAIDSWSAADIETAQSRLEQAWETTTEQAATIAEGIALLATQADQPMIEVEAYQRALQMQPSPARRAALAMAKLDSGDLQGASQALANHGHSSCELIAQAAVQLAMGQTEKAADSIEAIDLAELPDNSVWGRRLIDSLVAIGDMSRTIEVITALIGKHPTNSQIRRQAVDIYSQAGQSSEALQQAQILAVLEPSEATSKQVLADMLHQNNQPELALDLWLELVDEVPTAKSKVVSTALAAGKIDVALTFSQKLVEAEPASPVARLALGRSLMQAGNPQGGMVHIRRATELDPTDSEAWLSMAQAQLGEGMTEAAGETLAEAAQIIPEDASILSAYSEWLQDQERFTEAIEAIEQACQLEVDNPDYAIQRANLLIQIGQPQEARPLLEEVVHRQPANWLARTALASVHESAGEPSAALNLLEGLPQTANAEAFTLLARSLIASTESEDVEVGQQALAALEQAADKGYTKPDFDYWQARALQLTGQHDEALQQFQAASKAIPESATELRSACLQGQAEAALASDQVPVAISLLERARQANGLEPHSLALLSKAYLTAGLAEESLDPAVQACQQDPTDAVVRKQYLAACKATGGALQALEAIDQWIDQDAAATELLFEKAELHAELGQLEEARNALAKLTWEKRDQPAELDRIAHQLIAIDQPKSAMRLLANADYQQPDQPDRLETLAQACKEAGDHQAAAGTWSKLLQINPQHLPALLGAAEANWQLDQRMAAIGFWQRAVTQEPEQAGLHARLARAQLANGETNQALDHFRTAADLAPQDKSIRVEAARALMANHSYSEALNLLNNGISQDTEPSDEELGLLAQIYLGLGRPQEALASLGRSTDETSSAKLPALAALAFSRLGQSEQAAEKLQSAASCQLKTVDEATWLARAALELGDWQTASKASEECSEIAADPAEAAELQLAVNCRLADAYTLLASFGSAQKHAPSAALIGESAFRELSNSIDTIKQAGKPQSRVEAWTARLHAAFGRDHALGAQSLQSLPADHVIRQQATEGLALTQLESENPEGALRTLAAAPESLQAGPWSPLIAGLAHLQLERPEVARKAFGTVEKSNHLWPLAAFLVGKSWYNEARIDEAINSWNAAVLEWPTELRWQSELALAYRQLDKPEAALPHLQTALEAAPDQHDLRLPLARSHYELGEISEAVKQYQLVLPQFEEDPEVLTEAGQAFLANGQPEQAYLQFQRALSASPEHLAAEVGAAQAAWQQGDERRADKHIAKAIRRNPRQADLLISLTEIMLAAGKGGSALALLEQAYGQSTPPAAIARLQAKAHFDMGRAQDAITLLQQVVEDDPEDDQAWAAMAKAYASANQAGQAIDALRLALNLRPGHKPYRIKLARLFRETGQLDQALDELTDLQNDDPRDHRIPLEIGLVHRARRQLQQALAAFQQSISLNESSAAAYFQAGMALKSLKAYPQSVEMLERAVSLNPKDSEAMHQLAAVQALQLVHGGIQASAVST